MAEGFNPALPADNSLINALELRNQFVGLFGMTDSRALRPDGLSPLGLTVSDPPTQAEMQTLADRLDELLLALQAT